MCFQKSQTGFWSNFGTCWKQNTSGNNAYTAELKSNADSRLEHICSNVVDDEVVLPPCHAIGAKNR
jgi:hypothetical protein